MKSLQHESETAPNSMALTVAVAQHLALGTLLIWLDPVASLFGDGVGAILGLRPFFPAVQCIGLIWTLIAAFLVCRRRWVRAVAIAVHSVFMAATVPIGALGLWLLKDWGKPIRGHAVGEALAPVMGLMLIIACCIIAGTAFASIFALRRTATSAASHRPLWTPSALFIVAAGVAMFLVSCAVTLSNDR